MEHARIDPAGLGFDFDGVIANTAETFLRLACEEYAHCDIRLEDITDFDVENCLAMPPEIIQEIFLRVLQDSIGTGLRPMEGAVEVLGELTERSRVTVVTARPEPEPVYDWFESVMPRSVVERIHVVAMGSHDDKVRHVRQHRLSHFIDDRAETCLQLRAAGIQSIVFSQPWNRGDHDLPTVTGWQDIRRLCLA